MFQPVRPNPAAEFIRRFTERPPSQTQTFIPGALDRVKNALNSLSCTFSSATYGLRNEVPFERWYYNHSFNNPLTDPLDESKARFSALAAAGEGVLCLAKEVGSFALSLLQGCKDTNRHLDILRAQSIGIGLSLLAVALPNTAMRVAYNAGGTPRIGHSFISWQWGS